MLNKKSGHIVNISSVAGRVVFPAGTVYCATKHAIAALSEGLRQEFSQRANIRVTCIEPGIVATELLNTITDKALEKYVQMTKQQEASQLQSEDIANAILFAVQAPDHVNVNEILIRSTTQER
jgi:NADP-dependent 3-hydroxy acid dehydrogenase YdfG